MTVIEVFADVTCPFTHVGLSRWIERRLASGRKGVLLWVRAWPLELVNGEPLTGEDVAVEIEALRTQVSPHLFRDVDLDRFPSTTLPALRLTHQAYRCDMTTGEAVALELRDRLFERGEDIADPVLLRRVAARYGVRVPDADENDLVEADYAAGRARGVVGSPHFFGPGIDAFCPGLEIEHAGPHLHIAPARSRFDQFADACFETAA